MPNEQDNEDYNIPSVRMDQTMAVLAVTVAAVVSTFVKPDDTDEEKVATSWICISIFLHQLLSSSKHPDKAIAILKIIITELEERQNA